MSATLLIAALVIAQPAAPVKFNPSQGTKLTYTTASVTAFDGMGQTFNTTVKQKHTTSAEATVEGWIRVKTTIDEYSVQSEMPFGEAPDPTGLSTSVLVSPGRKQKDWKVEAPGKMTTGQVDVLKGAAKYDSESGFEGLTLPDGDLAVGTTWSHEHAPAGVGMAGMPTTTTGKVKTTYTVKELKDGVATIEAVTAGAFKMTIETDQGAFDLDVKLDENRKFSVRTGDGVVTRVETVSNQAMTTEFGEFKTNTKSTAELAKA
jgi:hypothetical protein